MTAVTARIAADSPRRLLSWIALFWLFSYAALTVRAYLVYGDAWQLVHTMRLISISAGTALFAGVVIAQRHWWGDQRVVAAVTMALPAGLAILAVRALYHLLVDPAVPLEDDLRWILVWAGYFGLWVATFVATERPAPVVVSPLICLDPAGLDGAIDALAEVVEEAPRANRATLIARLDARRGYDRADFLGQIEKRADARDAVIDALLSRLAR